MSTDNAAPQKRLPRAERERQMLDAAAEIFGEQGYAGANMDDIAARCGVTKPMIYNYFGSKKGLFMAVSDDIASEIVGRAQNVMGITDPDELLLKGGALLIEIMSQRYKIWMQARVSALADEDLAERLRQFRQLIIDVLSAALAGFKPDNLSESEALEIVQPYAHAAIGAIEAGIELWTEQPEFSERLNNEVIPNMTKGVIETVKGAMQTASIAKQS